MKLIIAGGRDYRCTDADLCNLDAIRLADNVTEVVCGGATGADEYGRQWAIMNNIPVKMFAPDWKAYGRAAGPIRNRQMAEYADAVVLFAGGRGTQTMFEIATELGLEIYDLRESEQPALFLFE